MAVTTPEKTRPRRIRRTPVPGSVVVHRHLGPESQPKGKQPDSYRAVLLLDNGKQRQVAASAYYGVAERNLTAALRSAVKMKRGSTGAILGARGKLLAVWTAAVIEDATS